MNSDLGNGSLYLCPARSDFQPTDTPALITALQETGLIAQQINPQSDEQHYFTGSRFLDYVAYMGCAPAIQFEASNDKRNFCFIKIHHYDTARLICSQTQARAPHCPDCNKPVKNWQQYRTGSKISCPHCDTRSDIGDYNWRKMAGYAQLFIEITDIFPKEAIPQQALLDRLASITQTDWLYFYSCE